MARVELHVQIDAMSEEEAPTSKEKAQALKEALDLWEEEYGPIGKEGEEWGRRELERAFRELSSSTPER